MVLGRGSPHRSEMDLELTGSAAWSAYTVRSRSKPRLASVTMNPLRILAGYQGTGREADTWVGSSDPPSLTLFRAAGHDYAPLVYPSAGEGLQ